MCKEMLELAARVEAASGPDRELDAEIGRYTAAEFLGYVPVEPQHGCAPFTASLDAAMMLVPEGWRWMAGHREHPHARAYVENGAPAFVGAGSRRNPARQWYETTAATPALALCAASLRARAQVREASLG